MHNHVVIITRPNELPKYIANVARTKPYKNDPDATIDPLNIPTEPLKYWKRGKGRYLAVVTKAKDKQTIDAKVKQIEQERKAETATAQKASESDMIEI